MNTEECQKMKALYKDLLGQYYAIVHKYGLGEIPTAASERATELMNAAEHISRKYPFVKPSKVNIESNATILGVVTIP